MDFESMLRLLPGIIVGLTVHEFAHASVASRLGDDTAKLQGRASLNPLVHIDPLGFIFLLVAGFGWAKPVVIDQSKLKHPRRDDAIIAAACLVYDIHLFTHNKKDFKYIPGLKLYEVPGILG